ncbi:response regulator transcription factor [Desulfonatronum parangueonense]
MNNLAGSSFLATEPCPYYANLEEAVLNVCLERRLIQLNRPLEMQEPLAESQACMCEAFCRKYEFALAHLEKKNHKLKQLTRKLAGTKKRLEKDVRKHITELEQKSIDLMNRTQQLRQANIALDVLVQKHENDRKILVQAAINQWKSEILPVVERLRRLAPSDEFRILVDTVLTKLMVGSSDHSDIAPNNWCSLTEREYEVALLLADGRSCREISQLLRISLRCVQSHCYSIRKKFNLPRKTRLNRFLAQTISVS